MVLLFIYIMLVIFNFLLPRSKIIFIIDFIYMWILMGWNHSVADYGVYLMRYDHPEVYGTLEGIYVLLQNIGKSIGLNYDSFLIVMSFVFLLIRMISIHELCKNHNNVVGLYLLFPFVMDITQLRMFYATSVFLFGMIFLLRIKNSRNGIIVFCILNAVATLIHAACIIYFLIPVAMYIDRGKLKKYTKQIIAIVLVLYVLLFSGGLYNLVKLMSIAFGFGRKFVETAFAVSTAYKVTHRITYMLEIILFFLFMNSLLKNTLKINKNSISKEIILGYKMNYIFLLILPLAWFSGDIYRIQHGALVFFYSILVNGSLFKKRTFGIITWSQVMLFGFLIAYIFLFLIGDGSLFNSVFWPAFYKNVLIPGA